MRKLKQTLFMTSLLFLFACQNDQIIIIEYWPDGSPKKIREPIKIHEIETNFHENGRVECIGLIINEKKEKCWSYYFPNGNIQKQICYKEGKPFDKAEFYYENGGIKTEGEYDEFGLKTGEWMQYHNKGRLKSKGNYSQGKKVKEWYYFDHEGRLESEVYLDDNGAYLYEKQYYEDGTLLRNNEYFMGGALKKEEISITSSKKHLKTYYQNGQLKEEGQLEGGVEVGKWTYYYSNGNKLAEGNFIEDHSVLPEGITFIKSKISEDLPLKKITRGTKLGEWLYWNEDGKTFAIIDVQLKKDKIIQQVVYLKR